MPAPPATRARFTVLTGFRPAFAGCAPFVGLRARWPPAHFPAVLAGSSPYQPGYLAPNRVQVPSYQMVTSSKTTQVARHAQRAPAREDTGLAALRAVAPARRSERRPARMPRRG